MHLPGQPDGRDVGARDARRREHRPDRRHGRQPTRAPGPARSRAAVGRRTRTPRRRSPRTSPRSSSRTALVAVVETSIPRTWLIARSPAARRRPVHPTSAARLPRRPDPLVDDVLEQFLLPGHRLRVDLAGRDARLERLERLRPAEDRRPEVAVASRRTAPRAGRSSVARSTMSAATSSERASVSMPPMWPWKRSVRSMLWRRSFASKLKPPVVNPPPTQDLVQRQRQLVDRVRELVGVPAVLVVAAVGVDAAEDAVRDRVGHLVMEACGRRASRG